MTEDNIQNAKLAGRFQQTTEVKIWVTWAVATATAALIGGLVATFTEISCSIGALCGATMGIAQAVILCRYTNMKLDRLGIMLLWPISLAVVLILSSIIAAFTAFLLMIPLYIFGVIGDTLNYLGGELSDSIIAVGVVVYGIPMLSIIQQEILRAIFQSKARWASASIVGWSAGWLLGLAVEHFSPGSVEFRSIAGFYLGSVVLGIITGRALTRMLVPTNEL